MAWPICLMMEIAYVEQLRDKGMILKRMEELKQNLSTPKIVRLYYRQATNLLACGGSTWVASQFVT